MIIGGVLFSKRKIVALDTPVEGTVVYVPPVGPQVAGAGSLPGAPQAVLVAAIDDYIVVENGDVELRARLLEVKAKLTDT